MHHRCRLAAWMLLLTLAAVGAMALTGMREEAAVSVRIVTVTRGDVRCVAALTGRTTWLEETAAYATLPGMVAEVLVQPGMEVVAGQVLARLDGAAAERAAAVWATQGQPLLETADVQTLLDSTVIRAPVDGTVRQVLIAENAPVMAGTPVAVLSSGEMSVVCAAAAKDASKVRTGMTADICLDGEVIGRAEVTEVGEVTADAQTGRMVCTVTLIPEESLCMPAGAAVEVDVLLSGGADVPVLPVEAITERGTVWRVYKGVCTEATVEVLLSDEMYAWVNLPEGTQVAVGEFHEGQRVQGVSP